MRLISQIKAFFVFGGIGALLAYEFISAMRH